MSTKKNFTFKYSVKEKNAEGKEVPVKKEGVAEEVLQFADTADILSYFEAEAAKINAKQEKDEAGNVIVVNGEMLLVREVNASFKATAIANKRAELTRKPILPKSIREKANEKLDASELETFNTLMAKLGLTQLPTPASV